MTIVASGELRLEPWVATPSRSIASEFGGTAPYNLEDYVAGGSHVPAGTVGNAGPIPAAPPIAMEDFYGASNQIVDTIAITEGTGNEGAGNSAFGYSNFSLIYGAAVPGTFRGRPLRAAHYSQAFGGFVLIFFHSVVDPVPADFITSVTPQDGSTFAFSAATVNTDIVQGIRSFSWLSAIPARWNGTGSSNVDFLYTP